MSMKSSCPVCASADLSTFFEVSNMPVHIGIQWPSYEAARECPRGDIVLGFCSTCGFIGNLKFEPALLEYSESYDNSLHFSPVYQEYAQSVAARLVERYDVHNKVVIDIGCGKGDFLAMLCDLGHNRGVGFDPSYEGDRLEPKAAERMTFITDYYSERYTDYQANLICSRYVFEHIPRPTEFLNMIRRTIGDRRDTVVYFEVPNVLLILRDLSVWDIIYEHCSYFSSGSLAYVFAACGFEVIDVAETYGGQFLSIEARAGDNLGESQVDWWNNLQEVTDTVAAFVDNYRQQTETWQRVLAQLSREGQRAIIWGAGAKGVSFLNILNIYDQIPYVVDINPHKQGKFLPGTGQKIVSPDFLREYRPDTVIVMNPIYKNEIQQSVEAMGLSVQFLYAA